MIVHYIMYYYVFAKPEVKTSIKKKKVELLKL